MSQWGRDELALNRRAFRKSEFDAAVLVLKLVTQDDRSSPLKRESHGSATEPR